MSSTKTLNLVKHGNAFNECRFKSLLRYILIGVTNKNGEQMCHFWEMFFQNTKRDEAGQKGKSWCYIKVIKLPAWDYENC